jgi:hypothetical protein
MSNVHFLNSPAIIKPNVETVERRADWPLVILIIASAVMAILTGIGFVTVIQSILN